MWSESVGPQPIEAHGSGHHREDGDGQRRAQPLQDGRLPESTHLTWTSGFMVESSADHTYADSARLSIWRTKEGYGTPLYWSRTGSTMWAYFGAHNPTAIQPDALSIRWTARLFEDPTLARQLPGVFGLVVIDTTRRRVFVAADRLGVQSVHYCRDGSGTIRLSTHLMWLLHAAGLSGDVNAASFLTHFGFGYSVAPQEHIYEGVRKLPPGGYLEIVDGGLSVGSYWSDAGREAAPAAKISEITDVLASATASASAGVRTCVGLTSGKDSLCLASVMRRNQRHSSATFGAPECADRQQAERIASQLNWTHSVGSLCGPRQFARWATAVGCHSAGLATASYADMAAFVAASVPPGHAFVMGEGGECVRDFFGSQSDVSDEFLRSHYMTEREHLRGTLVPEFARQVAEYPRNLLQTTRRFANRSPNEFLLWFYRTQRMPGNFSLRNAVLSALRPKLSPFLDARFIDAAYHLDRSRYDRSALHRAIIESARPELLGFFDRPIRSTIETQDWPRRFATTIGPVVYRLLDEALPFCRDIFDIDGVRQLCRDTIARPSRAIYHLLRVLSFALGRLTLRSIGRSPESFPDQATALLEHPALNLALTRL
jgi:hypothetical protein